MPAYGKTPDAFMASKGGAIEEASIIALRDAGAKLMLDFYRIPAVNNWAAQELKRSQQLQATPSAPADSQTSPQQANSGEASK